MQSAAVAQKEIVYVSAAVVAAVVAAAVAVVGLVGVVLSVGATEMRLGSKHCGRIVLAPV